MVVAQTKSIIHVNRHIHSIDNVGPTLYIHVQQGYMIYAELIMVDGLETKIRVVHTIMKRRQL